MIRHVTIRIVRFLLFCLAGLAAEVLADAADPWVSATDPVVATNSDCGFVTVVHGQARIRRSFLAEDDAGVAAHSADRVNSGDILLTSDGGRMELVSGENVVLVIGSGSRVKLGGLRAFPDASGQTATRLDVEILSGYIRVQVRRSDVKPEYVLASTEGADVLISRGDAALTGGDGDWLFSTLSGAASGRVRRGKVAGVPFAIASGHAVGGNGEVALTTEAEDALRGRLPFSFELTALALPPVPAASWELEAP